MIRLRWALRWVGRITIVATTGVFVSVVGLQYARIIGKNATMASALSATAGDIAALRAKRAAQDLEIRRLSDPLGAVPEIHDKLHLTGDREAIIYLQKHGDGR